MWRPIKVGSGNKIHNDIIRVAYQTGEDGVIGRSFEEAFIIKNKALILSDFEDDKGETKNVKNLFSFAKKKSIEELKEKVAYNLAPSSSSAKTNFAFDVMSFPEEIAEWQVPDYIDEGLKWLENEPIEKKVVAPEIPEDV